MIGKRLRLLREEKNFTQDELGKALSITQKTISNYEKDERFPDPNTLIKIANFFGVSVDYLLGQSEYRQVINNEVKEREISKIIQKTIDTLKGLNNLLLDGKPASHQSIEAIIISLKVGLEMARKTNKEKML